MKRRSFFGVLAGGICAALGVEVGNCQEILDGSTGTSSEIHYYREFRSGNSLIVIESDACLDHCKDAGEAEEAAMKGTWRSLSCTRLR